MLWQSCGNFLGTGSCCVYLWMARPQGLCPHCRCLRCFPEESEAGFPTCLYCHLITSHPLHSLSSILHPPVLPSAGKQLSSNLTKSAVRSFFLNSPLNTSFHSLSLFCILSRWLPTAFLLVILLVPSLPQPYALQRNWLCLRELPYELPFRQGVWILFLASDDGFLPVLIGTFESTNNMYAIVGMSCPPPDASVAFLWGFWLNPSKAWQMAKMPVNAMGFFLFRHTRLACHL